MEALKQPRYVGEELEWLEQIASEHDNDKTIAEVLAEVRERDGEWWAHEAVVAREVAYNLALKIAEHEGLGSRPFERIDRATELVDGMRAQLYPDETRAQ